MKKYLPFLVFLCAAGFIARSLLPLKNPGAYDVVGFGRLPVLANGRIKPLDTVARTSLFLICNSTSNDPSHTDLFVTPDGRKLVPIEWLLDVVFRSEIADGYQAFVIDNPDLLSVFGLRHEDGLGERRFAFNQLSGKLEALQQQARIANEVDEQARSKFQRATLQLYANVVHYVRLKHTFVAPGENDFVGDLIHLQDNFPAAIAAFRAQQEGKPHDEAALNQLADISEAVDAMSNWSQLLVVPPPAANPDPHAWQTAGDSLLATLKTAANPDPLIARNAHFDPGVLAYAGLAHAWRFYQPDQFNKLVGYFHDGLAKRYSTELENCVTETRFYAAAPFYKSLTLYACAFFLAITSWLIWPGPLGKSAFWLVGVAWLVATAGIAARMWLEVRPPVTNLYSSALFVGWGAVALCLVLEATYKNAIGSVAAGLVGFSTLLIAHHLEMGGDTLEVMRAVLNSNIWLATHVVAVSTGYAATFLAGFLALIYIFRGLFTTTLDKTTADALTRMVYGIVCFATLFSFVGTVLGGIWADQSWGRFWGWDPKENGALIIVIWNAIILHARWGGFVRQRGLMCLAVGGNIFTSWSWFGVNMLGVGLHSYGFTEAAFFWLSAFVLSQLAIILVANLPLEKWRSFRSPARQALGPVHAEALPAK